MPTTLFCPTKDNLSHNSHVYLPDRVGFLGSVAVLNHYLCPVQNKTSVLSLSLSFFIFTVKVSRTTHFHVLSLPFHNFISDNIVRLDRYRITETFEHDIIIGKKEGL